MFDHLNIVIVLQVEERARNFGSGLSHVKVPAGQKTFLGVYSNNCVDVRVL